MPLTVGTAGHIDHGKTWLVRALTGKDTDRLPEEKERGISIDLGYAPLELPDGPRLSLSTCPGHERFIRTMVAGATGIDLFLLVIDAAEGARPQTHEHLAILRLLGIEHGVVAVTKADAVDAETLELARRGGARARARRGGRRRRARRPARGWTSCAPRSRALPTAVEHGALRGATRLYVDRVFTLRGIGTVVTGTLWSGSIGAGDELRAEPAGLDVRVRSVQVHDVPVDARRGRAAGRGGPAGDRAQRRSGAATRSPSRRVSGQLPPGRRAGGARADRRRRAGARAPRDGGDSARVVRVGERVRTAAARRAGRRRARRPRRPPRRDDGRRRPRPRSGSPARASTPSASSCSAAATRDRS